MTEHYGVTYSFSYMVFVDHFFFDGIDLTAFQFKSQFLVIFEDRSNHDLISGATTAEFQLQIAIGRLDIDNHLQ